MDRDKDEFLSRDAVKGSSQEKDFARLDKDSDSRLSQRGIRGLESRPEGDRWPGILWRRRPNGTAHRRNRTKQH